MPAPAKPAPPGLFDAPLKNLSASVVVFLVALPLCMGIAIASGVPVSAGIITGIVGGIVVGFLAGAPLQVSGPAAGLTVIVYGIVAEHGIETLGLCVLLGGVVQMVCGVLKFGVWFRAVSPAVIRGMLAGIGVLIFASQMHVLVDDVPPGGGLENLVTIPKAVQKGLPWPELRPEDERAEQVELLKASGKLHEGQEQFREDIAGLVPTEFDPSLDEADSEVARGRRRRPWPRRPTTPPTGRPKSPPGWRSCGRGSARRGWARAKRAAAAATPPPRRPPPWSGPRRPCGTRRTPTRPPPSPPAGPSTPPRIRF